MKTYAHQTRILAKNPARQMLVWSTGSGKTLALLSLADKNAEGVLIIVPKSNVKQWEAKFKEYGLGPMHAVVMSKENFRKEYKTLERFEAVICDEIHHFSGHTSLMHKALLKYLQRTRPKYFWSGTATPYRSTPFNIFALARLHGDHGINYVQFREKTHHPRYLGPRMIWEKNEDEETRQYLHAILSQFSDFVKLDDCFDVPDQVDMDPEEIELNSLQKRAIADIKLVETNPLVLTSKMHQIEAGSLKGNEFADDVPDYGSAKDDRIVELAGEHGKLLVFCRYNLQIERLSEKLRALGYSVYTITGANTEEHYAITQIAEGQAQCVVIAQIQVAAGWELPSVGVVVYASMSYSYLDLVQSRGRVIRANKLGKHVFMYLIGGPVDKAVLQSVRDKRDFDPAEFDVV